MPEAPGFNRWPRGGISLFFLCLPSGRPVRQGGAGCTASGARLPASGGGRDLRVGVRWAAPGGAAPRRWPQGRARTQVSGEKPAAQPTRPGRRRGGGGRNEHACPRGSRWEESAKSAVGPPRQPACKAEECGGRRALRREGWLRAHASRTSARAPTEKKCTATCRERHRVKQETGVPSAKPQQDTVPRPLPAKRGERPRARPRRVKAAPHARGSGSQNAEVVSEGGRPGIGCSGARALPRRGTARMSSPAGEAQGGGLRSTTGRLHRPANLNRDGSGAARACRLGSRTSTGP